MTKAVILSHKGKGLYSARIEYDTDRLEDRIAFIQAAISATDDLIAELEEALAQVESDRDDAGQALRDAIAAYEQAKIDMELEKDQARLDAAAVRDQAIAVANGSHDSTVDRVDDDIQAASSKRQAAIAAANDEYAIAEAEHQQGMDDADHDFAVCVESGTEYATCRDTRDEEYERLDAALQDAADRRADAIASADDTYDSAYDRGQKTIEASEATRDAAIDKAEAAYVQTLANIDGDFKALEAPMQAVTEANLEYIKTLQPVQNAESQIAMQEINRLSAEQQLAVLQAAREERIEDVWCADYTLSLQPDDEAGLIWPDIDANKLPIVMPGGGPADYQARVASEQVMGPASSFFNRAIMPILQRMKPRHKIGSVTAVNDDGTLNVELRADLSKFGQVNTVIASGLSSVPVEYMNYGALPFEVGDDVVVRFDGIDQADPVVIGFEHDPKYAFGITLNGTLHFTSNHGWVEKTTNTTTYSGPVDWQNEKYVIGWRWGGDSRFDPSTTIYMGRDVYLHIRGGVVYTITLPAEYRVSGAGVYESGGREYIIVAAIKNIDGYGNTCTLDIVRYEIINNLVNFGDLELLHSRPSTRTIRDIFSYRTTKSPPINFGDNGEMVWWTDVPSSIDQIAYSPESGFSYAKSGRNFKNFGYDGYNRTAQFYTGQSTTWVNPNPSGANSYVLYLALSLGNKVIDNSGRVEQVSVFEPDGSSKNNVTFSLVGADSRAGVAVYLRHTLSWKTGGNLNRYVADLIFHHSGENHLLWSSGVQIPGSTSYEFDATFQTGGIRSIIIDGEFRSIVHGTVVVDGQYYIDISTKINPVIEPINAGFNYVSLGMLI